MAEITRKELMLALISAGDHPHLSGLDLSGALKRPTDTRRNLLKQVRKSRFSAF